MLLAGLCISYKASTVGLQLFVDYFKKLDLCWTEATLG